MPPNVDELEPRALELAAFYGGAAGVTAEAILPLARTFAALERMHAEALHAASYDALTGLRTRGAVLVRLEESLARSRRHDMPLAVLLIDLDHFKAVNDTHGHLAGDDVLRAVGATVRDCLRTTDCGGRYGGEELLVVAESEDPDVLAERIRSSVEVLGFADATGAAYQVTCSVGVAEWDGELDGRGLVGRADAALYAAKDGGRNQVRLAA